MMEASNGMTRATVMVSVGMALSGTAGLFSVASGQPTFNVVLFRCLFGAIALISWVWLRGGGKRFLQVERKLWPLIVVSGMCLVLNWLALFEAFHRTSIGFATIIYHLQPFWIVLAGGLFLKEAISTHQTGWICLAFVGLILTILPKLGELQTDANLLLGVGLALIASIFYAATTLTTRAVKGVNPDVLSAIHCLIGCIAFFPFLNPEALQGSHFSSWGWLIGMGIIHTGLVYVLLYSAYPKLPTTVIAAAAFVNPAAALLSDFLVFGRSISALQGLGLALILLAGLGVNLRWRFFVPALRQWSRKS